MDSMAAMASSEPTPDMVRRAAWPRSRNPKP